MFERQLGLRENPFLAGHHPKYVYASREHQEALAHLRYGIQNREPFVLITGEVGTGKTTAVYDALGEWGSRAVVALITNSALTRSELLEEICLRFGVAAPGPLSEPLALVQLERLLSAVRARGELAILLLDEAQNLDRELLEEIRLLSNLEVQGEKLLQIFLVGQPELEVKLAQPELRHLRQCIAIHYRILPLSASETAHYIHHRVAVAGGNAHELFPTDTCIEVFRITNGIPREINIVAGQALLNAFVEDSRAVTEEHVRAVEREIEFQSVLRDRAETVRPAAPPPPATRPTPHPEGAAPDAPPPAAPVTLRETPPVVSAPVAPPASIMAPPPVVPAPAIPTPVMETPIILPPPLAPARGLVPTPAPRAETPVVEPFTEPKPTMEPFVAEIPPMTPSAPAARPEPAPVREPAARAVTPPPARATAAPAEPIAAAASAEAPVPILPSWFDEVVARRKRMEQEEAAAASAPAPATSAPLPAPSAPAPESAPSASPPTFVPPTPAMSPGSVPAAATPAPARIAPHPGEPAHLPDRPAAPIDFLSPRLHAKLTEDEEQAPKKRTGFGWLVAATLVATLAISAILLVRFGPGRLVRQTPAPVAAPAPATAPPTAPPTAPSTQATPPTATSGDTGPETREPVPSASAPAPTTVRATAPATAAVKPPAAAPAKETAVSTATASTLKPTPAPATGSAATVAPSPPAAPPTQKKPAIATDLFGIAVGTYLNEDLAMAERTSLTESTRLPSRVVTVAEDSVSMYRVVMGSFENRVSAERTASDLIRRGLVNEARVIPLARAAPPPP